MFAWYVTLEGNRFQTATAHVVAHFLAGDKVANSRYCEFQFLTHDDADRFYRVVSKFVSKIAVSPAL